MSAEAVNDLIIDAIQDVKGQNILLFDLRHLEEKPADFFVICEGESTTQVKAIADRVYQRLKHEIGMLPNHTEGQETSRWILVDYFTTVVHVFYPEARKFYQLEELWGDAIVTQFD